MRFFSIARAAPSSVADPQGEVASGIRRGALPTDEIVPQYPDSPPPRYSFDSEHPERPSSTTGGDGGPRYRLDPPEWDSILHGVELEYRDLCERGGATSQNAVTHLTNMYKGIMTVLRSFRTSQSNSSTRRNTRTSACPWPRGGR
jgi:hypothetical protein